MRTELLDVKIAVVSRFFREFFKTPHDWVVELVAQYKQYGNLPLFPTAIADYYDDPRDKEVALVATLCMDWDKDTIYTQMQHLRRLMGEHPWEWFANREFISLSVGNMQQNSLDGTRTCKFWKIAKTMQCLYEELKITLGGFRRMEEVFPEGRTNAYGSHFDFFAEKVGKACKMKNMSYKASVIELVLRTSDGIGCGLWTGYPYLQKCPVSVDLCVFLQQWIPDYNYRTWDYDKTLRLLGLEYDYDFFYFWMAWEELSRRNPAGCSRFLTIFYSRYTKRMFMKPYTWRNIFPEIDFG